MLNKEQKIEIPKRSFEAFINGERRNQIYYLIASLIGLVVACGLIWWSFKVGRAEAATTGAIMRAAIPMIGSALSVTRIVACEDRIAKYQAAARLTGPSIAIALKFLEDRILSKGAKA